MRTRARSLPRNPASTPSPQHKFGRNITCEGVHLQHPAELAQVLPGMFTAAVFRILEPCRWVCTVTPSAVVSHICPDPPKVGLALCAAQRTRWSVIAVDFVRLHHIPTHRLGQGGQQRCPVAHPATHGGWRNDDFFACADLALPIQRAVVGVFAHHHMGNQTGTGHAAIDRTARCRCLSNRVALGASKLGADVANDLEAARLVVQHLGHVLPNLLKTRAAGAAFAVRRAGAVNHIFAREVRWQSALVRRRGFLAALLAFAFKVGNISASRIALCYLGRCANRLQRREGRAQKIELHLGAFHLLAGAAIAHALQVREFNLELLDGQAQCPDRDVALRDIFCQRLYGF